MNRYFYKDMQIDVLNESTYGYDSTDNIFIYPKVYFADGAQDHPTSKHGVRLYRDDEIIDSCIIIGSGGATGISNNSSLIDDDHLLICCCDTVFCLSLPDLQLKWKTQADLSTCFQIFKHQDDYIVHGEIQVSRLSRQGEIVWTFGGADIFVNIDNEIEFMIVEDGILLTDFEKTKYKIDFDGKLLWDTFK